MCDYSLTGIRNRLAVEGEQLMVHQFLTGSVGLASPADLCTPAPRSWRSTVRRTFHPDEESVCAVCVPPGARLMLRDIPERLQVFLNVRAEEEVTFDQVSAQPYCYRDTVRFKNGRDILLQKLAEGQRVVVLSLAAVDPSRSRAEEEAETWL